MITMEDTKGMAHIVIIETEGRIDIVHFTGEDAFERAHGLINERAKAGFKGLITVAVRVRQFSSDIRLHR